MGEAGVDEAVRAHYPMLVGVARRMLGSDADAEDVVQNALVSYLAGERRADASPALLVWLVRKRCLDELRSRGVRARGATATVDEVPLAAGPGSEPLHAVVLREELAELVADVDRLPAEQRRALRLRVQGAPHEEVAGELGLSAGASRALVARARDNLRLTREARSTPCAEVRALGDGAAAAGVRAPELVRRHLWTCPACRLHLAEAREVARRIRGRAAALLPAPLLAKLGLAVIVGATGVGAGVALAPWPGEPAPRHVQSSLDGARNAGARLPRRHRADLPAGPMVEVARDGAVRLYAQRSASGGWCVAAGSGGGLACAPREQPDELWLSVGSGPRAARVAGRVLDGAATTVDLRLAGTRHRWSAPVGRAGFFVVVPPRAARGAFRSLRRLPPVTAVARDAGGRVVARTPLPGPR